MARLRIEELLAERGRSLYWLAKESGLSHTSLFRLRHGQAAQIRLAVIDRLCATLECGPGDLIEITPEKAAISGRKKQRNR
ncbi:MAG TPA: helix-turn-helix transcriptional regulator [Blastocatellia bacterium]|nr:helix-turn-helix transcriptional regulator [Blastocatellia bacterium]